jgi:hypothetical protein
VRRRGRRGGTGDWLEVVPWVQGAVAVSVVRGKIPLHPRHHPRPELLLYS